MLPVASLIELAAPCDLRMLAVADAACSMVSENAVQHADNSY